MHRMILIALLNSSEIIITAAAVIVAAIERSVVAIVIRLGKQKKLHHIMCCYFERRFGASEESPQMTAQILCFLIDTLYQMAGRAGKAWHADKQEATTAMTTTIPMP
jgi:hypothetical protein